MKKLIAARPIQYMGRIYARGDTVPAYDGKMVKAWQAAGSAVFTETEAAATTEAAAAATSTTPEAQAVLTTAAAMTVDTLRNMGVTVDDENAFLGVNNAAELVANTINAIMSGSTSATEATPAKAAVKPEMVTGHLDAKDLEKTMTRDQLDKMATDMGLDISTCHNKGDVAALIAAEPVQAPKDENGGAQ